MQARTTAVGVGAVVLCVAAQARAQHVTIPVEDVRSQGLLSPHAVETSLGWELGIAPGDDASLLTAQLGFGPTAFGGKGAEIFGPLSGLALRARWTALVGGADNAFGPMTLGIRRSFPVRVLDLAPLAHLQTGLELAVSTPWLSDRLQAPPAEFAILHGADSELVGNGWSLRPTSGHLRLDFLACRSLHLELGAAPEVFIPTTDGETEYGVRYNANFGIGLACPRRPDAGVLAHLVVSLQYRARGIVERGALPPAYRDELGVVLQANVSSFVIGLFVNGDPFVHMDDHLSVGARLQFGLGKKEK